MSHSSLRGLFTLVSGVGGVEASSAVLKKEFEEREEKLLSGVCFSLSGQASSRKRAPLSGSFESFLSKLGSFLGKCPEDTWDILSSYLSGDFRGTRDSLKSLINQEHLQKPLIVDIWQFYRAERLYLLQVLKQILCSQGNPSHKHVEAFQYILGLWTKNKGEGSLKKSLLKQLRSVFEEDWDKSTDLKLTWLKYNLREKVELLQLLLLYFHAYSFSESEGNEDLKGLFDLFRMKSSSSLSLLSDKLDPNLLSSVGQLQALISIYLMNLPQLTLHQGGGGEDKESPKKDSLDYSLISSLGSSPYHGPIMLAWMLSRYLKNGELTPSEISIGERAVQLRVLHFLNSLLSNEVITNSTVKSIASGVSYSILSILITVFDPDKMGLGMDIHNATQLVLRESLIASNFWKQGFETGLGLVLGGYLTKFPVTLRPVLEICTSLSEAGPESAKEVISLFQNLQSFAEPVENVNCDYLRPFGDKWMSVQDRCPYLNSSTLVIPAKSKALSDGVLFQWKVELSGWQLFLCEIDCLIKMISHGAKNVSEGKLTSVTSITKLIDKILHSSIGESIVLSMEHFIESFFVLIEKFAQSPAPPIDLLANCVSCLSVMAKISPEKVWGRIYATGLFPYVTRSNLDASGTSKTGDINPGVLGALLAQQECVDGEYPLSNAFLDLLLFSTSSGSTGNTSPSLIYVVQEMLPSFQQWRFSQAPNKPIFGQKILKVCFAIISSGGESKEEETEGGDSVTPHPDKDLLCEALLSPAPCETLFNLVGIGDKAIQSILEDQSSWECGLGSELIKLVDLVLCILEVLIRERQSHSGGFQSILCSPSQGSSLSAQQPHFLLTIAHYIYHFQNPNIPISAVKLLSTVAGVFPMSLLACLGQEAEAFRDVLLSRLKSHTEDVRLKIAIVDFFSACIENQPGLVQLLIGGGGQKPGEEGEKKEGDTKAKEGTNNKDSLSSMDKGCLKSILTVMENDTKNQPDLLMAILNLVLKLWDHQRIVAVSFLKKQKSFWKNLSSPLFEEGLDSPKKKKLSSLILRIFSAEIFAFSGKVDNELKTVLSDLVDEKKNHLNKWNDLILQESTPFLLGAWKTFLIILTKDQPISISPVQCHFVAKGLIEALKKGLKSSPEGIRTTTSLCEMSLILMQKWMTKCVGSIKDWMEDHNQILEELGASFDNVHVRTKSSVLALAHTALKISTFKIEKEDKALAAWIQPSVNLVLLSIKDLTLRHSSLSKEDIKSNIQVPILAVNLLRNLIQRLSSTPLSWTQVWKESLLAQSVIGTLEHCLKHRWASGLVLALLDLLTIVVTSSEEICHSLLVLDLSQGLWLPLSDINPFPGEECSIGEDWPAVFRQSLRLATNILRIGKHFAVQESINAMSLLQDRVTSFLTIIPPVMNQVRGGLHLELTSASASFISLLAPYHKLWQLQHSSSFFHFYNRISSLLYAGVSLLTRPSLLGAILQNAVAAASQESIDASRGRRLSSSTDQESLESQHSSSSSCPETERIQNSLLDIISSCLKVFRSLSPDMNSFVSLEDHIDPLQWESLVTIAFSSPTFDEEPGSERFLNYGTLISLANFCVRSITRSERSPSPSGDSSGDPPERRRLLLVFEQAIALIIVQSLLSLRHPQVSNRDKQLLRRELGAEIGSFIESMRRFVQRSSKSPIPSGNRKTSPGGGSAAAASGGLGMQKSSYDCFIKAISSVVHNVYK